MSFVDATIDQAADVLRRGLPAVFPTDTVYGLGVSVEHALSPRVLFDLKRRSDAKPVAWLVADASDISCFGQDVPDYALQLAERFWPGPLTIIVKASQRVSPSFVSSDGTIGLRMPSNPTVLSLIRAVGCPLATTSANMSGDQPVGDGSLVDPRLLQAVGAAVFDDCERSGLSSTVVDCTKGDPVVLRVGSISELDLHAVT